LPPGPQSHQKSPGNGPFLSPSPTLTATKRRACPLEKAVGASLLDTLRVHSMGMGALLSSLESLTHLNFPHCPDQVSNLLMTSEVPI
jgi:hypothetical protein